VVWTTSEPYSAGTLFRLVLGGSDNLPPTQLINITSANADLTADIDIDPAYYTVLLAMTIGGEQIFIYQDADANPYFIFGLNAARNTNLDANFWQTSITASL